LRQAKRKNLWECQVEDQLSGASFVVEAQTVVNATGPWAGEIPHSQVQLRLTKGIHAVVRRSRLPVTDTVVMTEGKRILFAIPWGERTILGTTDTDYEGSLDAVFAEEKEIQYLLEVAERFFPESELTRSDVISTWAGLRPLIADASGKPSDISRSHQIRHPEPGWWDVAGGKLTTYRLMGEQTVDQIAKHLKQTRGLKSELRPCSTARELLLPAAETDGISSILPPEPSRKIVEHFCGKEWALHLDDVMLRRTSWHYYSEDADRLAERVADWMGELLGWTPPTRSAEIARYRRLTGRAAKATATPEVAAAR
jgi:glycerol-3-phosphate dehydrogenase